MAAQGYTEKAIAIIEELLKNDPDDAAMKKDLADIQANQKAVEKKGMSKFKGDLVFRVVFALMLIHIPLGMYNRPAKESDMKEEEIEEIKSPGVAGSS